MQMLKVYWYPSIMLLPEAMVMSAPRLLPRVMSGSVVGFVLMFMAHVAHVLLPKATWMPGF